MAVNLVTVTGNLETISGGDLSLGRVWFRLNRPDWNLSGDIFAPEYVEVIASAGGAFSVSLQSTDDLEAGASYSVILKYRELLDNKDREYTVGQFMLPAGGPYQLGDLLTVPFVEPVPADILALCQAYAVSSAASAAILNALANEVTDVWIGDGTVGPFALSVDPILASRVHVLDPVQQEAGIDYSMVAMPSSPSGKGILFVVPPVIGQRIRAQYGVPGGYSAAALAYKSYATRADMLADGAALLGLPNGTLVAAAGAIYRRATGATTIADFLGFVPNVEFTPLHWGAVGDGVTDDGAKINLAATAYRLAIESVPNALGGMIFSGLGRQYRSTVSINFTGITSWGWSIRNITIRSEATGKTALDMIGSRGGRMSGVMVHGHATNKPRVGIQTARALAGGQEGFADILHWEKVNTRGQFALSGVYIYGSESSVFEKCEWWNEDPDAHSVLLLGYDKYPVQSDFMPAATGEVSFINNTYTNCEFRHLPSTGYANITGVTLANPLVVTVNTSVLFSVGQTAVIGEQSGTPEMYNLKAVITDITGNNITFGAVDASAWSAYVSGGVMARAQSVATAVIGRMKGHAIRDCYCVNYGSDAVEWDMSTTLPQQSVTFENFLVEGYGTRSQIRFGVGTGVRNLRNFKYTSWGARTATSVFSTDADGGGRVVFIGAEISIPSANTPTTPKIFDNETKYTLYGVNLLAYSLSAINPSAFTFFGGRLTAVNSGIMYSYGDYNVGNPRHIPISGTVITDFFEDGAGAVSAFKRYDSATDAFTWSLDGTNASYVMAEAGLYPSTDNTTQMGLISRRWSQNFSRNFRPGIEATPPLWTSGTDSPEGVLTAGVGSLYTRSNGGAGTTLYVKESGTGKTGWVAK